MIIISPGDFFTKICLFLVRCSLDFEIFLLNFESLELTQVDRTGVTEILPPLQDVASYRVRSLVICSPPLGSRPLVNFRDLAPPLNFGDFALLRFRSNYYRGQKDGRKIGYFDTAFSPDRTSPNSSRCSK